MRPPVRFLSVVALLVLAGLAVFIGTAGASGNPPTCDPVTQSLRTGKAVELDLTCSDDEDDALTISTVGNPTHGTLSNLQDDGFGFATIDYTPASGYTGPDSFTYRANDGTSNSAPATVTLDVTANHPPDCGGAPQTLHTKVNTALDIFESCFDQDPQDQDLTYHVATNPTHGTVSAFDTSGQATYTPTTGFTGTDSFTFTVSDGTAVAGPFTQTIHVANTALCSALPTPTLRPNSDTQFDLSSACTKPDDVAGDLSVALDSFPSKGTFDPDSGEYHAFLGQTGTDSFSFHAVIAGDAAHNSPSATQSVNISTAANTAPSCQDVSSDVFAGRANDLPGECSDADNDNVTISAATQPSHGTLSVKNGDFGESTLVYTPFIGYTGPDSFTYKGTDSRGAVSATQTYTLNVAASQPPTCDPVPAFSVRPGQDHDITVDCTSAQGDAVSFVVVSHPAKGLLTDEFGGEFTYHADQGASGTDPFTVKASTAGGDSAPITITPTISTTANGAPSCEGAPDSFDPLHVAAGQTTHIDLSRYCVDPDGDAMQFSRVSNAGHGTVSTGPAATLDYTPTAGYTGTDQFTFKATDGHSGDSGTITFALKVDTSLAPTCTALPAISVRPGESWTVTPSCTEVNGHALKYQVVTFPTHGSITPAESTEEPSHTYTAASNAGTTTDTVAFRAVSDEGTSATLTQTVNISPTANHAPTCVDNSFEPQNVKRGVAAPLDGTTTCTDPDGDAITLNKVGNPQHGTLSTTQPLSYTSTAPYLGPDSFQANATDGHGGTSPTFTYNVSVYPPTGPVCTAEPTVQVRPGATHDFSLTDDCQSVIDEPLTIATANPLHGTLASSTGTPGDGFVTYTAPATAGADSFAFHASSPANGSGVNVTQAINVTASANVVPDCETFGVQQVVAGKAQDLTNQSGCTDADNDPLSFTTVQGPAHGTLSTAGGKLTYTGTSGYTGPDEFTYTVSDGHGGTSAPATLHVNVVPPQAPVCHAGDAPQVRPGGEVQVDLNCTDPSNSDLTYSIVTNPTHGTVSPSSGTDPDVTYTASAGGAVTDSFTYKATSTANGASATVTQKVDVDPTLNTAPVCNDVAVTAKPNVAKSIAPTCFDADNDPITLVKVTNPTKGAVTGPTAGAFSYKANTGTSGPDSFTYEATDGHGGTSDVATVDVSITTQNTPPSCDDLGPVNAVAGQPTTLTASCTDADGDPLTYSFGSAGHGTLTAASGDHVTYTPAADYSGPDTVTYHANDGNANSPDATISIDVAAAPPVNHPPACTNVGPVSVTQGASVQLTASCTDADGDTLTYTFGTPAHGSLSAQAGDHVTYTAAASFTGSDSVTYHANDGKANSGNATISITVTKLNHPPACANVGPVNVLKNGSATLTASCTDADGDTLTYSFGTPGHGTLSNQSGGTIKYTPTANFTGTDSVTYHANDGKADSTTATISLNVSATPPNNPPACANVGPVSVSAGGSVTLTASCTDADGDTLTYSFGAPGHGTLSNQSGKTIKYTPNAGYSGPDSVTYHANDGKANSANATISITVQAPPNHAPTCAAVSASTLHGKSVGLKLSCTDQDGNALTYSIVSQPASGQGTVALSGSNATYTPPSGSFTGSPQFTYRASDGTANSNTATGTIAVNNQTPTCATPAAVSVKQGNSVTLHVSCSDPDGDALTITKVSGPSHGTLGPISGGAASYKASSSFTGTDSVSFRASDGATTSNIVAAKITVTANVGKQVSAEIKSLKKGKVTFKKGKLSLPTIGKGKLPRNTKISLTLKAGKTKLGSANIKVKGGKTTVSLKLGKAGKSFVNKVKKGKKFNATLNFSVKAPGAKTAKGSRKLKLKK